MSQAELLALLFGPFQHQAFAPLLPAFLSDGQRQGFASILPRVLTIKCEAHTVSWSGTCTRRICTVFMSFEGEEN
jgi:hypothetical protein